MAYVKGYRIVSRIAGKSKTKVWYVTRNGNRATGDYGKYEWAARRLLELRNGGKT